MKLLTFRHENKQGYGIVIQDGIIDLSKRFGEEYHDLRSFLAANKQADPQVEELIRLQEVDYSLADITFLPVIPNPDKIICIGVNYDEHREEAKMEKTENPTVFFRVAQSQIGHEGPMILPLESAHLDYEGEIAVIIGREGRRISEEDALSYVAGYACYNDGSIRDWQVHTTQWAPGKNFDGTGAFGPWMVTRDEFADDQVLVLETRLNGEQMQHATTEMLVTSIPKLISYLSAFTTLLPGDVIVTGTPGGVGVKRNPPVFMKHGDIVEIEVSGVGILRNTVQAES